MTKDGRRISVETRMVLVRAEGRGSVLETNRDISERLKMEAELRVTNESLEARVRERTAELEEANATMQESKALLRTVTETARVGLVMVDEEHRYRFANRAYTDVLNLPGENIVGMRVDEVLQPVYETQIRPRLDRAFQGERVNYELRMPPLAPDTDDRCYAVSYEPGTDRAAKVVVVVIADITALKRTETKLRESLQETVDLRGALNQHAIVAITDPQGRITEVNDRFCEISQYTREELIGQDHRLINSGAHSKEFFRNLWKTIGQGSVWQGDIKNKAKDGTYYWVATTIVPFLDAEGKPRQYVAIRADITERKMGEEARARLSGIVRSSADAIIGKSLDGIITTWNSGAEKVFGYTAEEAIGRSMLMLFPPEYVAEESDILARITRDENVPHFETQRIRKDGRRIDVSVTVSPIHDSEGRIVGASKIARDITEQKRAEEALRVSEERYRSTLENMMEGCQLVGFDWSYLYLNDAAARHNRRPNNEMLGRKMLEVWPGIETTPVFATFFPQHEGARLDSRRGRIYFSRWNRGLVRPALPADSRRHRPPLRRHYRAQTGGGEVAGKRAKLPDDGQFHFPTGVDPRGPTDSSIGTISAGTTIPARPRNKWKAGAAERPRRRTVAESDGAMDGGNCRRRSIRNGVSPARGGRTVPPVPDPRAALQGRGGTGSAMVRHEHGCA